MNIENSEVPKQPDIKPKKHTGLRVGLAAVVGFLGTAGAILTGKAIIEEVSKEKASATEKQPGGKMPSEQAYNELVVETPSRVPTPVPTETPKPTATATKEPTPTPSPTPKIEKEKPTSLTAENFKEFVSTVSNEEFQRLAKSQPDNFAFPVRSPSADFNMTYTDKPIKTENVKGNFKSIHMDGSDMLLISAIDGEVVVGRNDRFDKERITSIGVIRKISGNTTLMQDISFADLGGSMSLTGNIGHTERGSELATASGKLWIHIYLVEKLAEPIIINRPDGGRTDIFSYSTYLTPSIFESSGWVSQDGKAVTLQK